MAGGKKDLGKRGEEIACQHLRKKGYRILERNYQTRFGEIDLIARDKDTLVFIEVKTRSKENFSPPQEAVNLDKQRQIINLARAYLARYQINMACRFDVLAITLSTGEINLIKNAFSLEDTGLDI